MRDPDIEDVKAQQREREQVEISRCITKDEYKQLASKMLDVAEHNLNQDLARISGEEFEHVLRRTREIKVQIDYLRDAGRFYARKLAALEDGEFTIDTVSGRLTFTDEILQERK